MNSSPTFQLFVSIPWGDQSNEISLTLEDYPIFAFVSEGQERKVRAPVRIRLDAWGGLHALADASLRRPSGGPVFIHHFDANGQIIGKTSILAAEHRDTDSFVILDYVVDAGRNCYLLEQVRALRSNQPNNRLRKISQDGKIQWSRTGPSSSEEFELRELKGTFTRLLMDGRSRLYLPATEHAGAIAEINPATGDVAGLYTSQKFGNAVFMNEQGVVLYVLYFPEANLRGLGLFSLAGEKLTYMVGGVELYGWLLYPLGVDASSNLYAWNDSAVARISFQGKIDILALLDNVVVRAKDRAIFSSRVLSGDEQSTFVHVERHSPRGQVDSLKLRLPGEASTRQGGGWKLIHVDEQDRYYVFGREEPGQAGVLLVFASDGEMQEKVSPPPDLLSLESRLESHSLWDVDSRGRIYLPVTDAQGFKVIRLAGP